MSGFAFAVNRCVFSPDGTELLAAGAEKFGIVYKIADRSVLGYLVGHNKQITSVDWIVTSSGDILLLTGSEDQTVKQWARNDVIPGDVFETFADDSYKPTSGFAIGLTEEGDLYAMDRDTRLIKCSDIFGSGCSAPFATQYGEGMKMGDKTAGILSPDGQTWALCAYSSTIYLISAIDGSKVNEFSVDVAHNTAVWDPTGKPRLFSSGHGENAVVWNTETGTKDCIPNLGFWVWDGSWAQKGRYLALANDGGTAVCQTDLFFFTHVDVVSVVRSST